METSKGDIVVDLYTDECPLASKNFLKLCKYASNTPREASISVVAIASSNLMIGTVWHCRIKYYNNCLFFNVQENFIAQTGDPTGTGKGGSSVYGYVTVTKYQ